MPVLVEDCLGARLAVGGDHLFEIARDRRIVGMDRMMHAGMAVTVAPDANSHFLKKFVRRHERGIDLHRRRLFVAARKHLFPHLNRRSGGRFMGDHRMTGVGQILDQHFPVAIVHVA